MIRRTTLLVWAMALATTPVFSDLPREKDRWVEVRSDHFAFFSNAGEKATRRIAGDLEELRAVLAAFSDLGRNNPLPIYVYVFRHDRSFEPYKMLYEGRPAATSGYFLRRDHANYIVINAADRVDASGIVYHEFVHYFTTTTMPGLPLWFEEGLAEVYQTFEVSGGIARIGVPIVSHIIHQKTSPTMGIEEVFEVHHGSPQYNEADRKGMFYSQSWALVHYLLIGNEQRRVETHRFLTLVTDGVPQSMAFAEAYSTDAKGLEAEVRRYLNRRIFPVLELPATSPESDLLTTREMAYSEVLYRLGDLLMQHDPPRPEVVPHLSAAVEHNPDNGLALAALALDAEQHARWDEADELYRLALRAAPNDALVQYRGGAYLLHRGGDVVAARRALQEATRLAPEHAPAWIALSGSYMAAGEYTPEAVVAAEEAHRLMPARTDVSAALLRQYLENDRRDDAIELVSRGFSSDPDDRRMAFSMIARSDLDRARQMVAGGQTDQALEALEQAQLVAAHGVDSEMLARHIAMVRSNIVEQRVNVRYNDAVAAYNDGDVDRARAILGELEQQELPGRHAEAVSSFIAFLDDPNSPALFPPPVPTLTEASPGEIDRLNELIAAGRLDEALALLEELEDRVSRDQHSWIDVKIAEIRRARDHNRFAESYNRAVNQFNGGAYSAAIETLEKLLATELNADQTAAAQQLLEDSRAALGG